MKVKDMKHYTYKVVCGNAVFLVRAMGWSDALDKASKQIKEHTQLSDQMSIARVD